jgi:hypothetical protein
MKTIATTPSIVHNTSPAKHKINKPTIIFSKAISMFLLGVICAKNSISYNKRDTVLIQFPPTKASLITSLQKCFGGSVWKKKGKDSPTEFTVWQITAKRDLQNLKKAVRPYKNALPYLSDMWNYLETTLSAS